MKKKIIIIGLVIVGIVYLVLNWKSLLLNLSGFQYPKIENAETIKSWNNLNTNYDLLVVASTKTNFNRLQNSLGVPGITVFNKDGMPIISNRGEGCQITARNKLKDLGTTEFQESDNSTKGVSNLNNLLEEISIINKSKLYKEAGYDYTVVYTWAKYLPKQSTEMMDAINEGLEKNKAKVLIISLNLDYVETWASGKLGEKIKFD